MSRVRIFMLFRLFYVLVDRAITFLGGHKFRQQYIRFSYRVKSYLFPEYDSHTSLEGMLRSPQQNSVWLPPAIPEWVLSEMKDLGREVDPALYPSDDFIASCRFYSFPIIPRPGHIYEKLIRQCTAEHYTHCFAIPWLKRGGADLVALKHIELANNQPGAKVLVMLTEPGDSPWSTRIPKNVDVLDVSAYVSEICHEELLLVISRLFVQLKIDVLHIINSRHVWEVVCKYGLAVRQKTKIFASIYCDDFDKNDQPVGFARQYLGLCYGHITKVFSDNARFPLLLQQTYGYRKELFSVLKSPIEINFKSVAARKPGGHRVLWAGRLDRQKRPDLLLAIARSMPDVDFYIYGDIVLDSRSHVVGALKKTKNVIMKGGFDGVENLPFNEFPVFLYTSQWDGTPTIVIAAALASIPMVASSVGGVGDIINEKTGFPVIDIEDISLYVNNIRYVLANFSEAEKRALAAKEYVEREHAQSTFETSLSSIQGYFSSQVDNVDTLHNEESLI